MLGGIGARGPRSSYRTCSMLLSVRSFSVGHYDHSRPFFSTARAPGESASFKGVMFGLWGIVARPSFSKHEEEFERKKKIPVGTFRRFTMVENGAIQRVLDGELGTTEGGAILLQELFEEGVQGCETLTPMDLSMQIRQILEAGKVEGEIQEAVQCLRHHGLFTGLLCHQWAHAGKSISLPEHMHHKRTLESQFGLILESKREQLQRSNPQFYRRAAERVGTEAREFIYVDWRLKHLDAAKAAGMATVQFTTPQAAVHELEERLDLPLRNLSWSEVEDERVPGIALA